MKRALFVVPILGVTSAFIAPAAAQVQDGVTTDPDRIDVALHADESYVQELGVALSAAATVSKVDVYLLADTTGSMGSPIGAVRSGALEILDGLTAELPSVDLRFGAGDFKDFPHDPYAFRHTAAVTGDLTPVRDAINGWWASGGGDGPEGQFYAYDRIAAGVGPLGDAIGWREDAKRVLVTFGDAPAHDPVCSAISGLPHDITEASVTTAFQEAQITFIGISTGTGYAGGMDASPTGGWGGGDYAYACDTVGGSAGQATRLAEATNGVHLLNVASHEVVDAIRDQIESAARTINRVELQPRGDIAGFVTGVTPASYGPLASGVAHDLDFDLTFTGPPCTDAGRVFTGAIDVLADGTLIASVDVAITSLGPDGHAALHGTPAEGAVSGTVAGTVIPAVRAQDDQAADLVATVNCDVIVPVEDTLGGGTRFR